MTYTTEEREALQRTARTRGAVGRSPTVYRLFRQVASTGDAILAVDFGSGPDAVHAEALRSEGYSVTAHDLSSPAKPFEADYVLLSNVLNVQPSWEAVHNVLEEIKRDWLDCNGCVIVNVASSPRKPPGFNRETLLSALFEHWEHVAIRKIGSSTVLVAEN